MVGIVDHDYRAVVLGHRSKDVLEVVAYACRVDAYRLCGKGLTQLRLIAEEGCCYSSLMRHGGGRVGGLLCRGVAQRKRVDGRKCAAVDLDQPEERLHEVLGVGKLRGRIAGVDEHRVHWSLQGFAACDVSERPQDQAGLAGSSLAI